MTTFGAECDVCDICYGEPLSPARTDGLGAECGGWADYWASLTPNQQWAEQAAMQRYSEESDGY